VDVPINATVANAELSIKQVRDLKAGDVIPVEMADEITLTANGIPTFRTKLGVSNGNLALKVTKTIPRAKEEDRKFKFVKKKR